METKVCTRCKEDKPVSDYHCINKKTGYMNPKCKVCSAVEARGYRQANRDYVAAYKLSKGCEVCGFEVVHHCQLDLHHIDPSTKTYKGSHKSYDAGWSKVRIDAELKKCIVICKNCHALETQNEGHWKNPVTDINMR